MMQNVLRTSSTLTP